MKTNLRLHRILIGGKCSAFDEDLVSFARGPVERCHHQMQIHCQRIHHHDFAGCAPTNCGGLISSAAGDSGIHGFFAWKCPSTPSSAQSLSS